MGLSNYYIALIFPLFIVSGFIAPFLPCLGYLWVDTFYPQYVSTLLTGVPVSLIMGSVTLFTYLLFDRRYPPRITLATALTLLMAVWVTMTCVWAAAPGPAWIKWDWAFKTIAFSAFIPIFIRSRLQIEAFWQVFLFSCALHILPVGIKGLTNGGGYAQHLGMLNTNVGLEESSTLAAVSIMFIPIILHLRRYSLILKNATFRTVMYSGYVLTCCSAAVASGARTGLVGFAVLGVFMWLQSRHRIFMMVAVCLAVMALVVTTPQSWKDRMSTIETPGQDELAKGRLLVWQWTWNYVKSNPLGGGFRVDTTNHIVSEGVDYGAKAFHSIYFEVLGEHGYPGLAIFLTIISTTIINLRRVMRRTRDSPDLLWCYDLARAMFIGFLILLACGAFIGIAFQCMLWYMFALTTSVSEYVRRAQMPAQSMTWATRRSIHGQGIAPARLAQ